MPEKKERTITLSNRGGIVNDITQRIKLIVRLIGDERVSPLLKILPIGAVIYLLFPDLLIGPFDDAAIIWLGSYLFIELCPPEVVQEHVEALNRVIPGQWRDSSGQIHRPGDDGEVVDAEYWEEK